MSKPLPDLATLDDMLLDVSTPGEEDELARGWEALVETPGGVAAWREALARRQRLDRMAALCQAHPWLARPLLAFRRLGRRLTTAPSFLATAAFPPTSLLDAVLEDTNDAARTVVQLTWGDTMELAVPAGEIVALEYPLDASVAIYYRTSRGEGRLLPGQHWRMEPDEAPVLLVLATDGGDMADMLSALDHAPTCAAVLLVLPAS